MNLSNFSIYTVCVQYEFDEGFQWGKDDIQIIAQNDEEAIQYACTACKECRILKPDLQITETHIISQVKLIDIYESNGVLSYTESRR